MMKTSMRSLHTHSFFRLAPAALAISALLCGCAVGPDYKRPDVDVPSAYKEAKGWTSAAPADAQDKGEWWKLFGDPALNDLIAQVNVSNQNIAQAAAAYEQARSLISAQRAAYFPTVSLNGGATRSGGSNGNAGADVAGGNADNAAGGAGAVRNTYRVNIGATWEPDVWGRLRRAAEAAGASVEAGAADLAAARLSAQGELAADYFSLRQTDAQKTMLDETVAGYQRALQIAQNRYAAGIAAKTDVLQAQTQLANAQADAAGLARQRATLEHAIAVLVGKAPGDFTLSPAKWNVFIPEVPPGVPSTLLQRRPDIASAERRVAAANAEIGVAEAAYFPSLSLTASDGFSSSSMANLLKTSSNVWSVGLSAAQTVFDAGATHARVSSAAAARDQAAARYRQTVLTAFQDVEDQLTATRVLAQQEALRRQASQSADEAETQMVNRYRVGQVDYSQVVSAQAAALSARRALVQAQADRQTAAVALIQSLGGTW